MKETNNIRILVVDDDIRLRALLQRYLKEQGFSVSAVNDTAAMDGKLLREQFQLIVLDLMLPDESGLDACKRLRKQGNEIPIIMLTAKGEEIDRILGLEFGADDYLPKPFNPRELIARINAVLRRHKISESDISPSNRSLIKFGDFELNIDSRSLFKGKQQIGFASGLYDLLKILATRPNTILSRSQILGLLNDRDYDGTDRAIDIQISRLRKLIEKDPKQPQYIQTVWGVGYIFVPSGQNVNENTNENS